MSTLPIETSISLRRPAARRLAILTPFLDSASAVLLPALAAVIIAAFIVGHGHLSAESVAKVFDMMGQTSTVPNL